MAYSNTQRIDNMIDTGLVTHDELVRHAQNQDVFMRDSINTLTRAHERTMGVDESGTVSRADVSFIGGNRTWPPADSSMISRADWAH